MRITVVLDCRDPDSLVEFWSVALGYTLADTLDEYRVLVPAAGRDTGPYDRHGPVFILAGVDTPKAGKNRMHVDVHPADADAHLSRLRRLGGRFVGERVERFGTWWQVMADPEGNELCVVSGAQSHDEGDASG
jgi:predicted enzyme related to lactoylglutathione lyase